MSPYTCIELVRGGAPGRLKSVVPKSALTVSCPGYASRRDDITLGIVIRSEDTLKEVCIYIKYIFVGGCMLKTEPTP